MGSETLDAQRIRSRLKPVPRSLLRGLTILPVTDSTNAELARMGAADSHAHALLAEAQTRGRGRRERQWHSPAGGNIYLSLGWVLGEPGPPPTALPLAVAVCACRALAKAGLRGHGIKWPNDILIDGRKLAGILVETRSAGSGPMEAIIGIGLNVSMPDAGEDPDLVIDQPWTDLAQAMSPAAVPGRNQLAALLLNELLAGLVRFTQDGFAPFVPGWGEYDLLSGQRVCLQDDGLEICGSVLGIDALGRLEVDIDGQGLRFFLSGDVSLRYE
jgi:BirA family biotin operon repressor/biotin-[acetyl-CoA-carboxylase] ligase